MTNAQTTTLVFKNDAGSYFLLPQETLEQGRVPDEQQAAVERLIAEADDVAGFGYEDYASFMNWWRRQQSNNLFRLTGVRWPII